MVFGRTLGKKQVDVNRKKSVARCGQVGSDFLFAMIFLIRTPAINKRKTMPTIPRTQKSLASQRTNCPWSMPERNRGSGRARDMANAMMPIRGSQYVGFCLNTSKLPFNWTGIGYKISTRQKEDVRLLRMPGLFKIHLLYRRHNKEMPLRFLNGKLRKSQSEQR